MVTLAVRARRRGSSKLWLASPGKADFFPGAGGVEAGEGLLGNHGGRLW